MYTNRIKDLELQLSKHMNDHVEVEKKLRKEIEVLSSRATDLETKVVEVTSQVGSEGDGVSLASDSTLPLHMASSDERIAFLEKELNHYRTQYELMKINEALRNDELLATQQSQLQSNNQQRKVLSSQSSTSSSMSTNNNHSTFVNYPTSSHSSGSGSKSSPCQNSKR
jgi:phospholipid N-methyltransferase